MSHGFITDSVGRSPDMTSGVQEQDTDLTGYLSVGLRSSLMPRFRPWRACVVFVSHDTMKQQKGRSI